ncbi:hypothetical protein SS50377_27364 [Spironucleus salmonicida]|uniref:Uncharacterized protein n=1 Tax=Spironucleus salmonicida TaxID=348837 RepID=V6LRC5_9EUKA|nr:hypothetical protein SS50377_27364 [Spironucleus salmonicida]|eukprot:EST43334.1 Hypothetical protein SS50377_17011 [Spironucleus salmonicida]
MGCLVSIPSDDILFLMKEPKEKDTLPPWMIGEEGDTIQPLPVNPQKSKQCQPNQTILLCMDQPDSAQPFEMLQQPQLEDCSKLGMFDNQSVDYKSVVWNYTKKTKFDQDICNINLLKDEMGIESIHEEDSCGTSEQQ